MKKLALILAVILAAVSLGIAQTGPREFKTLVWNNSHVVSYEKRGNRLVITMEMIADFEDDRTSQKWQDLDFTSMRIDINNNRLLDGNVDIGFGQSGTTKRVCPHYLIDDLASSPCGRLASRSTLKVLFAKSPFHDTAHPIFEYVFPIDELNTISKTIGLQFKFHSRGKGFTFYPSSSSHKHSFDETITLNLGQL